MSSGLRIYVVSDVLELSTLLTNPRLAKHRLTNMFFRQK